MIKSTENDCIIKLIFSIIFRDNPRFGKNDWQNEWHGDARSYTFGEELDEHQRMKLLTGGR